ncbi:hypothetical protein [Streptomyces sp. 4F14]|uniref:hypothetical protein n=1 Tax=Streptomyces sp. 4F14 TaxID=3394380 RepID=UPI003A86AFBE
MYTWPSRVASANSCGVVASTKAAKVSGICAPVSPQPHRREAQSTRSAWINDGLMLMRETPDVLVFRVASAAREVEHRSMAT